MCYNILKILMYVAQKNISRDVPDIKFYWNSPTYGAILPSQISSEISRQTPSLGIPCKDSVEERKSYSAGFEQVTGTTFMHTFYRELQLQYVTIATLKVHLLQNCPYYSSSHMNHNFPSIFSQILRNDKSTIINLLSFIHDNRLFLYNHLHTVHVTQSSRLYTAR